MSEPRTYSLTTQAANLIHAADGIALAIDAHACRRLLLVQREKAYRVAAAHLAMQAHEESVMGEEDGLSDTPVIVQ